MKNTVHLPTMSSAAVAATLPRRWVLLGCTKRGIKTQAFMTSQKIEGTGVKRSHEAAFIEVNVLLVSKEFAHSVRSVSAGQSRPNLLQIEVLYKFR